MPLETLLSDPLEAYSGLSLFPRTFASIPNPPPSYDPDNLRLTHDFLNSMPFESSDELIEQAKSIVADSSELLSSDVEVMENIRERRPALDRKRPRFSLKPNLSQATVNLEPSLDIDKLNDPEDFFVAFERAENAKREIEKQTGSVLMEKDQNIQSMAERPRRPGLLRRSVKYQHRYSTAFSSVESFEEEIPSPVCNSQQEKSDTHDELQEELSLANAENTVNELLDDLLTNTHDGDEAVNLLQERLQIKPIDLEKISLPDLPDIRRIDLKASRENLVKPRSLLSDIQNLMKGISKRTPKQKAKRSVDHLDSPTPPRSPLASILLLKRQKLQSDLQSDPFSTDDSNQSPVGNASHTESNSKQSNQVNAEKELSVSENNDRRTPQQQPESPAHHLASPTPPRNSPASISLQKKQMLQSDLDCGPFATDNMDHSSGRNASPIESADTQSSLVDKKELNKSHLIRSPLLEANLTAIANASSELDGRDFAGLFDKYINDNARRFDHGNNVISTGSQANLENLYLRRPETESDSHTMKPNEYGGREEDIPPEAVVSSQIQVNEEGPTIDNSGVIQKESDESNPAIDDDRSMNGSPQATEIGELLHEIIEGDVEGDDVSDGEHDSELDQTNIKGFESLHLDQEEPTSSCNEENQVDKNLQNAEPGQSCDSENQSSSNEQQNKKGKIKPQPVNKQKRKAFSRRQSLAGSGTTFDVEGRRRSTRIRSRPLEFWKGERFLYGRVHSSLATVIGIKYESPGKSDGRNPTLKVKSFVSDEYKELIDQAARF